MSYTAEPKQQDTNIKVPLMFVSCCFGSAV